MGRRSKWLFRAPTDEEFESVKKAEKYRLDGATLAGLAALAAARAGKKVSLPDKQANGVNRMLAYHAAHQLGKPLKTARHAIPEP